MLLAPAVAPTVPEPIHPVLCHSKQQDEEDSASRNRTGPIIRDSHQVMVRR
ncbi:MAG: hypothetical protein R3C11_29360 [Planctomycetaceae bacterium]